MDITPLIPAGRQIIQGYTGGVFRISGKVYETAVFVCPEVTRPWPVLTRDAASLTLDDFAPHIENPEHHIEFILLGCGAQAKPVASLLRQGLCARGITIETMDTGAACRTYNVLMAEGRLVAAALL